jgi:hypothetical protein
MLKNISSKNGKALIGIAFSFLLSNVSLGAAGIYNDWTPEEDQILEEGVETLGVSNWDEVAALVPNRTPEQCRDRWIRLSKQNPNRGRPWTEEEDRTLIAARRRGDRWTVIAGLLQGRTEIQGQYRFPVAVANAVFPAPLPPRLPASRPALPFPRVVQAEVPAGGNPAAVADAVFPALLPPRLPASQPAPLQGPVADRDGTPAVADGAVGHANPFPVLLEPRDDQA